MVTREKLYEVLGELAVAFSNLEHNVLRVLDVLARGDAFLGPILLDGRSISRVLDYMRTYIKARLRDDPDLRDRAETLVREVNEVRIDRNLFIHGQWPTDAAMLAGGRVTCFQYKLHYDKETDLWKYGQHYNFTLSQLALKTLKISTIRDDAIQLGKDIKAYLDSRD